MTAFSLIAHASSGFENIRESDGISVSITGMLIVFLALMFISIFIAVLPRLLKLLESVLPESAAHHAQAAPAQRQPQEDEAMIAALAYAMHVRRTQTRGG